MEIQFCPPSEQVSALTPFVSFSGSHSLQSSCLQQTQCIPQWTTTQTFSIVPVEQRINETCEGKCRTICPCDFEAVSSENFSGRVICVLPRPHHLQTCWGVMSSLPNLLVKPADHQSSPVLPVPVITLGNCHGRSGRALTV